ncbi:MAG: DUF1292 domain-containing protein [Lachnospiraceae bacterium]|nr:DUF1292 domain-containing protein [Lachnospiraceae bacterium]
MTEQIVFTNEDGEDIRFYVIEQTMLAGVNYLLVTDGDGEEADAYIMKNVGEDGENGEFVCEFVEDGQELEAISKVFAELLDDVSIEVQE